MRTSTLRTAARRALASPPALLRRLRPVRTIDDEYVAWLTYAIAGMQHPGNPYLLDLAVRLAPPAPMLEIGSFCGLSANLIQYLKRRHGREEPLFCCDRWIFEGSDKPLPPEARVSHAELRDHVMDSFVRAARCFSAADLPHAVEATSDEMFGAWRAGARVRDVFGREVRLGGPLGFCFVDGDHREAQVERDFAGCDELLLAGGLILFDDSGPGAHAGVQRVVARVARHPRYEVVARNPNHLVRKLR
ncbi:MAG TPA: class I SAM-dependent methyltransferase [Solirubrobacteraceae bacterium]|nr:class I SAM-dependent methyltransferase [Solirubrobacteraceae bacterium]